MNIKVVTLIKFRSDESDYLIIRLQMEHQQLLKTQLGTHIVKQLFTIMFLVFKGLM